VREDEISFADGLGIFRICAS